MHVQRLLEAVTRSESLGASNDFRSKRARHEDDRQRAGLLPEAADDPDSVVRLDMDVHDREVNRLKTNDLEGLRPVRSCERAVAHGLQRLPDRESDPLIVIDDQGIEVARHGDHG